MDIIVTMPDVKKEGYEKLIKWYEEHKDEQHYFRVSQLPKNCVAGEWCWIVSNGHVFGKHKIVEMRYVEECEAQELFDEDWHAGNYIIREGKSFERDDRGMVVKGFQGFHYKDGW